MSWIPGNTFRIGYISVYNIGRTFSAIFVQSIPSVLLSRSIAALESPCELIIVQWESNARNTRRYLFCNSSARRRWFSLRTASAKASNSFAFTAKSEFKFSSLDTKYKIHLGGLSSGLYSGFSVRHPRRRGNPASKIRHTRLAG